MSLRSPALLLSTLALALAPTAISAQAPSARFVAELATPTAETHVVAGGVVWRCEATRCTAPFNGSRAARMCTQLGRELGPVARFEANGVALNADELARCNG